MLMIYKEIFSKEEAFSLLEVVIGIAILSIVLIPTLSFFSNSLGFIGRIDQRTRALNLAQQTMEELKADAERDFNLLEDKWNDYQEEEVVFSIKVVVGEFPTEPDKNIKKITVTVSWEDQKIKLVTLIAEKSFLIED
ncbi:prepilin-type N-terminal cleavage/methylation domain-containing protein [Natroniella sp. ANB-PHB2]|uniref:type IV pilus modification PilV family protein n=1 Tax=Natroniella sp. ANB-PHB2 TaxID=3384444 RepID=UPI0038D4BB9B